ncbi:MAG: helix-turn-helix domain-containing protein [Candidatus Aenigmarchaeota archaeon]|nr:helix-turn-helix domain-containing protein [Candidatus Aenigmarchaeota archaeon]
MARESETEDIVYNFVCSKPGMSTYELSKKLNMTGGRVRHALARLEEKGLIKFKFDRHNPRIRKLTFPVDNWSLIPRGLKKELKKLIKK